MLIEIRNAGFVNKGAELMLHAIMQKMKEAYPQARFAMSPSTNNGTAPFAKRSELGFLQKAWIWRYGFQWGDLAGLAPDMIREMYGVVLDKEINIVLDASGFCYSDQWGIGHTKELARSCKRWRKRETKVILLPQAFGPFTSVEIKELIRSIVENVDLIFARDPISYQNLADVVGKRANIEMAPDFTNLVKGILPSDFDFEINRFCIIPNYRMIDKTTPEQSHMYLPFLIKCAKYLFDNGAKPFILVHEGANDLTLAQKVSESSGGNIPIIQEGHPLKIKGILGACEGIIGSRFHGLVSALSQGVPALGTGWSHKYKMLFNDYDFAEGIMDVMVTNDKEIHRKLDLITEPNSRQNLQKTISAKSKELKKHTERMWTKIFELLKNQEAYKQL